MKVSKIFELTLKEMKKSGEMKRMVAKRKRDEQRIVDRKGWVDTEKSNAELLKEINSLYGSYKRRGFSSILEYEDWNIGSEIMNYSLWRLVEQQGKDIARVATNWGASIEEIRRRVDLCGESLGNNSEEENNTDDNKEKFFNLLKTACTYVDKKTKRKVTRKK